MRTERTVSVIYAISGAYDGILGVGFLLAPAALFALFKVTPPNHYGYVQFPAAILITFALMFFTVSAHPRSNRNLMPYGILLKVAYCGVVFGYWFTQGLPFMWKPFAILDVIFAVLFFWAWRRLGSPA